MKLPHPRTIAVIGGGASAALFLAALPDADITVDVYDRAGRFARGIAYSTAYDHHLLNVRAGNMSALASDKDHFAQWAAAYGYSTVDFVPRRLYGDYLEEIFSRAEDRMTVNKITADVQSSSRDGTGFSVNGKSYDAVILATGNAVPLSPALDGAVACYHAAPWNLMPRDIDGAKNIALIGTGLSAVDAALTLQSFGYDGRITMISRRTLLPAVHVDPASWPHPPLAEDDADKPLSHLVGMVRMHVREAAAQGVPWQAVIDSLRGATNPIWKNFDDAQRARFMKRLLTLWNIHRHRMAPQIGAQMDALRDAGKLFFLRDTVRGIGDGPVVRGAGGDHRFDAVINCMGYRYREPGRHFEYSHAIGPARFGDAWFETTAIPEIRAQAQEISDSLFA